MSLTEEACCTWDGGLVVLLDAGRSSIAPPAWTGKGEGERCEVEHDSLVKKQAHGQCSSEDRM